MTSTNRAVVLRDVSMRDGLQDEAPIPTSAKLELFSALVAAGVRELELTSFVRPDRVPAMADADELCAATADADVVRWGLVLNRRGAQRALDAGLTNLQYVVSVSETHSRHNAGMGTEEAIAAFEAVAAPIFDAGAVVEMTLSTAFGCPYEQRVAPGRVVDVARRVAAAGAGSIGLADTIGVALPAEVGRLVDLVAAAVAVPVGVHLHDTRGLALANALAALDHGVVRFDASVGGLGGCPFAPGASGNLPIEDLAHALEEMGVATGCSVESLVAAAVVACQAVGRPVASHVGVAGPRFASVLTDRRRATGRRCRTAHREDGMIESQAGTVSPMDAAGADWLTSTRVAIVAGKGGVGSSTVAAAYALAAARAGADVLFVAVDGRPGMGPLLGGDELGDRDRLLQRVEGGGRVRGRTIPAEQAFSDYLELRGVGGLLRRAATAASLPMIAAATPGLEHLLVLGMIKQLEKDGAADLIVVDAPPAGHAAPFLRSARGLSDVVRSGPVMEQADEVSEMLADPARSQVMLVTLPEETPVNEVIELAADLGDDVGMTFLPLVLNGCWADRPGLAKTPAMAARSHKTKLSPAAKDALESAAGFGRVRLAQQDEQLERLRAALDLPVIQLPRLVTTQLDADGLAVLADVLGGATA